MYIYIYICLYTFAHIWRYNREPFVREDLVAGSNLKTKRQSQRYAKSDNIIRQWNLC